VPNIVLEYSSNVSEVIDFTELFALIHKVMHEVGSIKLDNCKSRVVEMDKFYIGDGHPSNAFVQLSVAFLAGRSNETKQKVGNACLAQLKQFYEKSMARLDLQITVEIADIQRENYFKYPEGTFTVQ
jgi:5-carboxymethyl-2-hydroxymuconate isomerase